MKNKIIKIIKEEQYIAGIIIGILVNSISEIMTAHYHRLYGIITASILFFGFAFVNEKIRHKK